MRRLMTWPLLCRIRPSVDDLMPGWNAGQRRKPYRLNSSWRRHSWPIDIAPLCAVDPFRPARTCPAGPAGRRTCRTNRVWSPLKMSLSAVVAESVVGDAGPSGERMMTNRTGRPARRPPTSNRRLCLLRRMTSRLLATLEKIRPALVFQPRCCYWGQQRPKWWPNNWVSTKDNCWRRSRCRQRPCRPIRRDGADTSKSTKKLSLIIYSIVFQSMRNWNVCFVCLFITFSGDSPLAAAEAAAAAAATAAADRSYDDK